MSRWGEGRLSLERLIEACRRCSQDNVKRLNGFDWTGYRLEEAAVLLPLINSADADVEPSILFTVRSPRLSKHAGQVCFPGGMINRDESPSEAAKRELREEVNIDGGALSIVGPLGIYPNKPSKLRVHAFVGVLDSVRGINVASPDEVSSVFTARIAELSNPKLVKLHEKWPLMPEYTVGDHRIWGMTGYILHHFLSHIQK